MKKEKVLSKIEELQRQNAQAEIFIVGSGDSVWLIEEGDKMDYYSNMMSIASADESNRIYILYSMINEISQFDDEEYDDEEYDDEEYDDEEYDDEEYDRRW